MSQSWWKLTPFSHTYLRRMQLFHLQSHSPHSRFHTSALPVPIEHFEIPNHKHALEKRKNATCLRASSPLSPSSTPVKTTREQEKALSHSSGWLILPEQFNHLVQMTPLWALYLETQINMTACQVKTVIDSWTCKVHNHLFSKQRSWNMQHEIVPTAGRSFKTTSHRLRPSSVSAALSLYWQIKWHGSECFSI